MATQFLLVKIVPWLYLRKSLMQNVFIVQNQDIVDFKDPNEIKSFVAFSQ